MPVYNFECSFCRFEFEEYFSSYKNSGKTDCTKCGNTAFKIPSVFNPRIFRQRKFADGTKTPDFVRTPKQEKAWLKSQGITYDKPTKTKYDLNNERRKKNKTAMEIAFKKAIDKCEQGFKPELQQKEVKNAMRYKA